MMFFAVLIGLAERSVLPMAITRMVEIPNQNVATVPATESVCAAPDWAANNTDSISAIDQSVSCLIEDDETSVISRHVWSH